mgnify:FL=1|tara:strand:+ start:4216 stop:4461 length:246 start_codon:yes stop_codon:yes gene_type:complete
MTTTKYLIYSISNCPFCDKAKELLRHKQIGFYDIAVDMKKDIAIDIVSKTGLKTWPQIFIDGSFIGGYTELKQYFERKVYE